MTTTHIIAMGGGGFLMDDLLLDRYILQQVGKQQAHVCYLGQAKRENENDTLKFYRAFTELGCVPTDLSLFLPHTSAVADFLLSQDLIYIGGGNTKSMLALWREWELDVILRRAWQQGTVLAGPSAGAICWFTQGLTDSLHGQFTPISCLGFLSGSCAPHYDVKNQRRSRYRELIASGELQPGYGIDDYAALHFVDGDLHEVVASRLGAYAYRVERREDGIVETELEPLPLV